GSGSGADPAAARSVRRGAASRLDGAVLELVRAGTPPVVDLRPRYFRIEPDGREPVRVERVFRPYPFLHDGDRVVDASGTRWWSRTPYWFGAGGATLPGPRGPLPPVARG